MKFSSSDRVGTLITSIYHSLYFVIKNYNKLWLINVVSKFALCSLQKKQREFEDYIKDKHISAKADFRTLLKETKFITYK